MKNTSCYVRAVCWLTCSGGCPKSFCLLTTPHHNHFMTLFPRPPGWASARRELVGLVQGKIKRGRHTDHPAGRHSIQTKHCPPPPSPLFTDPFPQIDIIRAVMIVWRVRGKMRSFLCYIVCDSCAQCNAHTWTDLTVLWNGFCLTGPISLCLDSFLYMYYCMHV